MEKMIACCGIDCISCPARLATVNNDQALREKTAVDWSAAYQAEIKPEDVKCEGCNGGGVLFHYPTVCEIRACVQKHELKDCSECPDYACEMLEDFFAMVPMAKDNLDALRS
jgi:hypothetical protein